MTRTTSALPSAPVAPFGPAELTELVRELAADQSLWRPLVRFSLAGRWWTRLPAPDGVDAWLLTWLPDQRTGLHDHGDAASALTVVDGRLDELRATRDGVPQRSTLTAGTTAWMAPGLVHDVRNTWARPAVSVHAYAPRLTATTYHRRRGGRYVPVRTVRGDRPESA